MKHFEDALTYLTERLQEAYGTPREHTEPEFKLGRCPLCNKYGRREHELTTYNKHYVFYHCSACDNLYAPYTTA